MQDELNYALSKRKVIVPILQKGIAKPSFLNKFRVFEFSPWNAGGVEAEVSRGRACRRWPRLAIAARPKREMMRVAVIDGSSLMNLTHLELTAKLALYFNVV
jgi:hypothetical protein